MSTTATNVFGFSLNDFADWLDPAPIYDAIGNAAGVYAGIVPVILSMVFVFRYFSESARNLSGKARFGEAIGDLGFRTIITFAYAAGGFLILKLILALASYFYLYGSFSIVAADFSELIASMKQTQKDYDSSFIERVLDIMSAGSLPLAYLAFMLSSSLFVVVHLLLRISYAVYFGIIYLWGFIAIPSGALTGAMNLQGGWVKSIIGLAVWPILEATMYLFMKFLLVAISAKALSGFNGAPIAAFMTMHSIMAVVCLVMTIMSIASAYMTVRLVSNQEALSGIVGPALAAGVYMHSKITNQSQQVLTGSSPTIDGERKRDSFSQGLLDINQHPISSLKKGAAGLGNAVTNALKKKSSG